MLGNSIITQTDRNGQHPQPSDNQISTDQIAQYTGELLFEVKRLEDELTQKRTILKLYQSWLSQRMREGVK